MRSLATAILVLVAAIPSRGAAAPITIGETTVLPSKVLGEERTLLVSLPARYDRSAERYPVLYMTDGDAHLVHTRGTVDILSRNGLMPDMIIVGIQNTDRSRDLTPTRAVNIQRDGTRVEVPTSGGAGRFLEFFEKELFPHVESRYRTAPYRVFAGHSLGGLLALHALVARPELFNSWIAASPYLAWDDNRVLAEVDGFFKDRKEFQRTLFVTMGNEEAGQPSPTRFERLVKTLSKAKASGFSWDSRVMPDESHGSVVLRSHYWGLRKIFEGWQLPVDSRSGVFAGTRSDIERHYERLGRKLGYPIVPPEASVNQAGYQAMGAGDLERATSILRYNLVLHPESPNAHDSLGEALERQLRLEEALACYEKAVEKGSKGDPRTLRIYTGNRDRVRVLLAQAGKSP